MQRMPPLILGGLKSKFCRASGKDCFCSQLAYCQCLSVGAHPKGLCNLKTLTRRLEHYIRLSLKILFFQRIHVSFLTTYPLSKRVNQNKFSTPSRNVGLSERDNLDRECNTMQTHVVNKCGHVRGKSSLLLD